MQRRTQSVGSVQFSSMTFVALVLAGSMIFGCKRRAEDDPVMASPTTTGIPIGAPGAQGVRFDPAAPVPGSPPARLEGVHQKVNPGGAEPAPVIPPSPFGVPPEEDDPPPPPIKKKPTGGTPL